MADYTTPAAKWANLPGQLRDAKIFDFAADGIGRVPSFEKVLGRD
jgi:hypothetical protein